MPRIWCLMMQKAIVPLCLFMPAVLSASAQPSRSRLLSSSSYLIRFDEQLNFAHDLRLSGNKSSISVPFKCESSVKPLLGSALHLFIEHSPHLDGDRSFLSVSLNYGLLRSVRLDEQNENSTDVVVPLPPNLLKAENELVFSVEEYPVSGASMDRIWAAVKSVSYILIRYEKGKANLDLGLLPSLLVDRYSYRPKAFELLLPKRVSVRTLQATALLVANFSNRLAPEPVSVAAVKSIQAARHPLLIVGTPLEQPQLESLQHRASFSIGRTGGRATIGLRSGERLSDSEGLVGLTTRSENDANPILFVTGGSSTGVLKAARNLLQADVRLSGSLARISKDTKLAAATPRQWKGFIPSQSRFGLVDLGVQEVKFSAQNNYSLVLPLNATPDARFISSAPQMVLLFRFNPAVYSLGCQLKAELNETRLALVPVSKISIGPLASWTIAIPTRLLKRENLLRITLVGPLQKAPEPSVGSMLPDSQFYLPRDYEAELPDLSLLQFHLYPFTLNADLSDTIIVLPDTVTEVVIELLVELSTILGRFAPSDRLLFKVGFLRDLTEEEKIASNLVFLDIPGLSYPAERVFPGWPRLPRSEPVRSTQEGKGFFSNLFHRRSRRTEAFPSGQGIQEVVSPWNSKKFVLCLTASSTQALQQLVKEVFSETTLAQLSGDACYPMARGVICFNLAPKRSVGETFYLTHLEAWLSANWLALPIILAATSAVLFVGLRLALTYYKGNRRAP